MVFKNRQEAGKLLYQNKIVHEIRGYLPAEIVVLSISSGGYPIGQVLAEQIHCAHLIFPLQKIESEDGCILGIAGLPEKSLWINHPVLYSFGWDDDKMAKEVLETKKSLQQILSDFHQKNDWNQLKDKLVLVVDQGILSGETMKLALQSLWQFQPQRLTVAVPLLVKNQLALFKTLSDSCLFLQAPDECLSIKEWYGDYPRISWQDIIQQSNIENL